MDGQQATSAPASDTAASDFAAELLARRASIGTPAEPANPVERWPALTRIMEITPEQAVANERRQRDADDCDRRARMMAIGGALIEAAGERYRGCRIENYKTNSPYQAKVLATVAEYAASVQDRRQLGEGLTLFGPVGTGKDHLAFAVARAAVIAGFDCRWLNGQDWFGKIRDSMDDDTSEASLIRQQVAPDFLVISDPQPPIGNLTQHQSTMLYRAVHARYMAGKPTIVTLNVANDAEADARLGVATWDRMCHKAWKVFCNWPSYRKPARVIQP